MPSDLHFSHQDLQVQLRHKMCSIIDVFLSTSHTSRPRSERQFWYSSIDIVPVRATGAVPAVKQMSNGFGIFIPIPLLLLLKRFMYHLSIQTFKFKASKSSLPLRLYINLPEFAIVPLVEQFYGFLWSSLVPGQFGKWQETEDEFDPKDASVQLCYNAFRAFVYKNFGSVAKSDSGPVWQRIVH
jgi:hypothetical protein